MDGKKISFGFSKITKKPALQLNKTHKDNESSKIELIKCLEGQQIKLVEERKEEPPMVIPLKDGGKTSAALASLAKRRAVLLGEDDEPQAEKSAPTGERPCINGRQTEEIQNLDKRAENEILAELKAKNDTTNEVNLVLPVVKPDELPLDGAKESTLDDYESVPIGKYGWAMLRGMGAVEPSKSNQKIPIENGPMQRPPGLGLGADKAIKSKPLLELPEANEKLEIKKQAFVRILAGKYKDAYGKIEGFDHERGTIIVKLAIGSTKQKFQEFLCQPVSKKEYEQYGKCINKAKYEEYKKLENEHGQVILKEGDIVNFKNEKSEREYSKDQTSLKVKAELSDLKNANINKNYKSDEFAVTSSSSRTNRFRSRSRSRYRSRSSSRSKKHSSIKRHNVYKKTSELDSDSNSSNDYRKSKSSSSKSKKTKKKRKRHHSSSNESNSNSEREDSDQEHQSHHKRDKKKKSKKKTKKSKRARSRTPVRSRR